VEQIGDAPAAGAAPTTIKTASAGEGGGRGRKGGPNEEGQARERQVAGGVVGTETGMGSKAVNNAEMGTVGGGGKTTDARLRVEP